MFLTSLPFDYPVLLESCTRTRTKSKRASGRRVRRAARDDS